MSAVMFCGAVVWLLQKMSMSDRWSSRYLAQGQDARLDLISKMVKAYANDGPMTWFVGLGNSSSYKIIYNYPHNLPVEVLTEEGAIGLTLLLLFIGSVFISGLNLVRSPIVPETVRFNVGLLTAFFTFYFILSLKEGNLIGGSYLLSTGSCIAWAISRYSQSRGTPEPIAIQKRSQNTKFSSRTKVSRSRVV